VCACLLSLYTFAVEYPFYSVALGTDEGAARENKVMFEMKGLFAIEANRANRT